MCRLFPLGLLPPLLAHMLRLSPTASALSSPCGPLPLALRSSEGAGELPRSHHGRAAWPPRHPKGWFQGAKASGDWSKGAGAGKGEGSRRGEGEAASFLRAAGRRERHMEGLASRL